MHGATHGKALVDERTHDMDFDANMAKEALAALASMTQKDAFAPPPQGAPPAQGAPMDPAMAGGAPPMDPAMAGGAPMDPAMAQGAPMDPAMAGGAPADPAMAQGGTPITVTLEDLVMLFQQVATEMGGAGGGGEGAPNEPSPDVTKALDKISQRLDAIEEAIGGGGPGAGPAAPGDVGAAPEIPPEVAAMMPEMGAGAPPFSPTEPLPEMPNPMIASASDVLGQVKSAKKIGDIIAGLRSK